MEGALTDAGSLFTPFDPFVSGTLPFRADDEPPFCGADSAANDEGDSEDGLLLFVTSDVEANGVGCGSMNEVVVAFSGS